MRLGLPRPGPARVVAVTTAVALAAGAAGWLVGARVRSPADAAAAHRPPPASLITVAVERRTLTATVTAQGTVAYGAPQPLTLTGSVAAAEDGTVAAPLVTKAPAAGRTLREGDVLLEVSGRPVFVFKGSVPMYRILRRGSSGDDVQQLRAALRRLLPGRGVARSGPLDGRALDAVARWYDKRGYEAVGPSREQRAEVRRLEEAVRSATGPALADAKAELADVRRTYGISIAGGEVLFLPRLPVRLTTVTVKAGGAASGVIGTVSDPALVVNGDVATDDADLVRTGMPATLEHSSGATFPATLSAMGAGAVPAAGASADGTPAAGDEGAEGSQEAAAAGTPIRLRPRNPAKLKALAGQSVKITIKVGGTGHAVLAVPVAAVYTASDGQARVSVQDGAGKVRDVPVEAGLTTGGYVQVTPGGAETLTAGDRVVVGNR
ncbi:hypothetical protein [Nucisporomicrobium flavum]|uniref:hypothetical protein n=1 Tax=Nucisporomicrobium flavum TaxID=2785915 RepID=UPI0018F5E3F2|nr:hypothetical protein [Nucisporomicrobium flavum]